jgi:hypothetical protein
MRIPEVDDLRVDAKTDRPLRCVPKAPSLVASTTGDGVQAGTMGEE